MEYKTLIEYFDGQTTIKEWEIIELKRAWTSNKHILIIFTDKWPVLNSFIEHYCIPINK